MALSRRGGHRGEAPIWPGFVDAMTALLLVVMFVLSIFMIVQAVLRETIDTQGSQLDSLTAQIAGLADALGAERTRAQGLSAEVGRLGADLTAAAAKGEEQAGLIASLTGQLAVRETALDAASAAITGFESQVAALLAERDAARGQAATLTASVSDLEAARAKLMTDQEALTLALASAREEVDAQAEAARLAAARREALEALTTELRASVTAGEGSLADALARLQTAEGLAAGLQADVAAAEGDLTSTQADLSKAEAARLAEVAAAEALRTRLDGATQALNDQEKARLADMAAAEALRARLASSDAELTAMTLALEAERQKAEDTLTLLAAARTDAAKAAEVAKGTVGEREALLAAAQVALSQEQAQSVEAARKVEALNRQVAELRGQLRQLQGLLDASAAKDAAADVRLDSLGSQLNSALARAAAEQKKRADLEAAERARLEAEAQDLQSYRSEFFGQLSRLLDGRDGVRVVGDRFVFSSEVLFNPGSADLAPEGRTQISRVATILKEISEQIPPAIDWIIRVDGHTDDVPLSGTGAFRNNWELSQARALSVVLYMVDDLGFPPKRLAATGFGEWQPVAAGDSPSARAQNRRIELKLTER